MHYLIPAGVDSAVSNGTVCGNGNTVSRLAVKWRNDCLTLDGCTGLNCLFSFKKKNIYIYIYIYINGLFYCEKGIKSIEKGHCILRPYFSPFSEHADRTQNYPSAGHLSS